MPVIVCRVFVPCLLLVAGIACTIYGAKYHAIPVVQEREKEITIALPSPSGPAPPAVEDQPLPDGSPGAAGQPPGMPSAGQPSPASTKALWKTPFATDEMESKLMREASVGGVTLADSGKIKRTYSGDQAPTLCPT